MTARRSDGGKISAGAGGKMNVFWAVASSAAVVHSAGQVREGRPRGWAAFIFYRRGRGE
jgi:hypothetical protein